MPRVAALDPTTYVRHRTHLGDRVWAETNCYTDVVIELLHGLGHEPLAAPLSARLELELWGRGPAPVEHASIEVEVAGGSVARFGGDALLGHFADLVWAYRFGPRRHDCVVARQRTPEGRWLHDDVIFRPGAVLPSHDATALSVGVAGADGERLVTLATTAMLQAVALTAEGWEPDDNFLHLAPGCPREVRFRPVGAPRAFRVEVSALNLRGAVNLRG